MKRCLLIALLTLSLPALYGCQETADQPMETVPYVDLDRFMGDWYVVANIPTVIEKGAHNALESYKTNPDGSIATTFSFNDGAPDGPRKAYHPTGFVLDSKTNALWGMRFIWPIKAHGSQDAARIPSVLRERLRTAAHINALTEIEEVIPELDAIGPDDRAWAAELRRLLEDYDTDGIAALID